MRSFSRHVAIRYNPHSPTKVVLQGGRKKKKKNVVATDRRVLLLRFGLEFLFLMLGGSLYVVDAASIVWRAAPPL